MNSSKLRMSVLSLALIVASNCLGSPGSVTSTKSKLDKEQQVQIEPGNLKPDGIRMPDMKLGGFWTSKEPDLFYLDLVVTGVESISKLKIGIDGDIFEFDARGQLTKHDYKPGYYSPEVSVAGKAESSKRFVVPMAFLTQLVSGKVVIFQASLNGKYREGEFSFDQTTYARPAFRKAIKMVKDSRSNNGSTGNGLKKN